MEPREGVAEDDQEEGCLPPGPPRCLALQRTPEGSAERKDRRPWAWYVVEGGIPGPGLVPGRLNMTITFGLVRCPTSVHRRHGGWVVGFCRSRGREVTLGHGGGFGGVCKPGEYFLAVLADYIMNKPNNSH